MKFAKMLNLFVTDNYVMNYKIFAVIGKLIGK